MFRIFSPSVIIQNEHYHRSWYHTASVYRHESVLIILTTDILHCHCAQNTPPSCQLVTHLTLLQGPQPTGLPSHVYQLPPLLSHSLTLMWSFTLFSPRLECLAVSSLSCSTFSSQHTIATSTDSCGSPGFH